MVEKKTTKLARAQVTQIVDPWTVGFTSPWGVNSLQVTGDVDKMEIPKDYKRLINICRFFYRRDPIAASVVNKIVDMAISEMRNRQSDCTNEEFYVYDALTDKLQNFYRDVCLEYLLSGLVIPQYEWVKKPGDEVHPKLDSRRRVWVPDNIWFRDPATIRVEKSVIPNKRYYYVTIDQELVNFIKSGGKRKDGTYDKETYQALVDNYKEFIDRIKESKGTRVDIELTDVRPILGRTLPEDPYPVPYMSNALESLIHKRNIRKMDYSIAARVTAAIQLVQLGSDLFPTTDEEDFDVIRTQMNYKNMISGETERIYQLFANHTLKIQWIFPDTTAMLNNDKYREIDDDIIAAFGFPRTLITGETIRSNVAGGSDFATSSPTATMEAIRDKLVDWTIDLYKEIKEKNKFSHTAIPRFEPMKIYRILDLSQIGQFLYQEGSLSRTSRLEAFGYDIDTEYERKKDEQEKIEEYGLEEAPPMPYSSPQIGKPQGQPGNPQGQPQAKPASPKKEEKKKTEKGKE
jgi:hypothetical protein